MSRRGTPENLIKNSELTPEERREKASKAGIASGRVRRENRDAREVAQFVLKLFPKISSALRERYTNIGVPRSEKLDTRMVSFLAVMNQAMTGDLQSLQFLLKMSGEYDEKLLVEHSFDQAQTIESVLDKMSDEQLKQYEAMCELFNVKAKSENGDGDKTG